jgi:hypothetical protein
LENLTNGQFPESGLKKFVSVNGPAENSVSSFENESESSEIPISPNPSTLLVNPVINEDKNEILEGLLM